MKVATFDSYGDCAPTYQPADTSDPQCEVTLDDFVQRPNVQIHHVVPETYREFGDEANEESVSNRIYVFYEYFGVCVRPRSPQRRRIRSSFMSEKQVKIE